MKTFVKKIILKAIPKNIKFWINFEHTKYGHISYSMEGEDRVLQRLMNYRQNGIFVDVGAHLPKKYSNTYYYYKMGWRGINIDAMPGSMDLFNKMRPNDINIEVPISDVEEELFYYVFNATDLNTFDPSKIDTYLSYPGIKLKEKIKLKTRRLEDVLSESLPKLGSNQIDFLSIDVEGWDMHVIKSNNWNLYRPEFLLVEDLFSDITETLNGELTSYLISVGYKFIAKTHNTAFYKRL